MLFGTSLPAGGSPDPGHQTEGGSALADPKSSEYLRRVWRGDDGLMNPVPRAITQSSDGYLWLATEAGLIRFDGKRFAQVEERIPGVVHDRWIVAVIEAGDGSIWTSSVNGGVSRWKDGQLVRYGVKDGLPDNQVLSLYEDREGTIWIGSAEGLTHFRDGKFQSYSLQAVRAIAEDRKGNLWLGTPIGLTRMRDGAFTTFTTADGLSVNSVMALHVGREDNVFIGTSDGLTVYNAADGVFHRYTRKDGLAHGFIRAIYQDRSGRIWIGSHGGLQHFRNGRFEEVAFQKAGLSHFAGPIPDFVYSIFQDREGSIWVGTNLALNQLSLPKFRTYSTEQGLPHEITTSVYEDSAGSVWIGTWGGGLARLRNGEIERWTDGDGLSSNFILGILEDSQGNLWIGTDGDGLNHFSEDEGFTNFQVPLPPELDSRAPNTIRLIFEDSRENLWIGTNRGLFRFVDGMFQELSFLTGDAALNIVKTIVEDANGVLWIGSTEGLTRVEGNQAVTYDTKDGLSGLPVNAIFPDGDGLWLSTDAGGLEYFEDGRVAVRLTEPAGIMNERVLHILNDGRGFFWMTNRNGIFRVDVEELRKVAAGVASSVSPTTYGRPDGMRRAQCNGIAQPSGWRDRKSRLWFPTMDGAVVFDPTRTPTNELPPPVVIETVHANGEPVDGSQPPPGHRNVEFRFTALSLQVPEKVTFRYKLEGFDSDWQDAENSRSARYNNLRPGDYSFRVIAANNDGVWNETGATFALTLPRHFHETYWFYSLCVFGLVAVSSGIFRIRVRRMRQRESELSVLVDERTRSLREKIIERDEAEKRMSVFSKLGEKLSLASTFEEAATVIFDAADRLLGWDSGYFHTYGPEKNELIPIVAYDIIDGRRQPYRFPVKEKKLSPMAQRAIENDGELILRQDPLSDGSFASETFGDESRPSASIIYVPIRKGTDTVGILSIQSYAFNAYCQKDLQTLQSLADYCAGAIERIRAEQALHESQQLIMRQERLAVVGQLSAGVAHEFNNILTIVKGYAELALQDPTINHSVTQSLREASIGVDRAAELTRQLLAFSRKQVMHVAPINLNSVIDKLSAVLGRLLGDNVQIDCRPGEGFLLIQADAGLIEQVVMNLSVNARDAMPHGGALSISTAVLDVASDHPHPEARAGRFACLDVSDTGSGMDKATADRIFEPFFSTKEVGRGTGLGLASVYGIVKQHKGWIEVHSEVGRGTTFRIFLPLENSGITFQAKEELVQPVEGGAETILVVEDETHVRKLICTVLHRQGYRVLEASTGEEALHVWNEHQASIALLFTDIIMPGLISGMDLAYRLLDQRPTLAVICSSGYNPEAMDLHETLREHMKFLPKPHSPEMLARVVRECLDAANTAR